MPRKTVRGSPSARADLGRPLGHALGPGELLERRGVDGDGVVAHPHDAAGGQLDGVAVGAVADAQADQPHEVGGAPGQLEADQVGAEQTLEDLAAPGQLLEQLGRRERDVEVEPDAQVGPQLTEHLRHQLQLVVLHPHRRALRGDLGRRHREALVDRDVGLPPLAVELRLGDEVVVERPQRAVGEALVELLDLLGAEGDRDEAQAVLGEGLEVGLVAAGPADPGAVALPQHRLERGDEPARGAAPRGSAVGVVHPVDGQAVGHDHEVRRAVRRHLPTLVS